MDNFAKLITFDSHIHLRRGLPPDLPVASSALLSAVDDSEWNDIMAADNPQIFPACGIHPLSLNVAMPNWQKRLDNMAGNLAAIGEIGLDFSEGRDASTVARQTEALLTQFDIAARHGLPVILHLRQAWDVFFNVCTTPIAGIIHNFTGSADVAHQCLNLGLHLSFSTAVFNKNADRLRQLVADLPANRIFADTDWPYRNGNIEAIIAKIAEIRGITFEKMNEIMWQNAKDFLTEKG